MEERLRLSELDAWRNLTADDPFGELAHCWSDDLSTFRNASEAPRASYEQVLRTQLSPALGHRTIGEISVEQIELHLAYQMVKSEDAERSSREVLGLLMDFVVGEWA